jgi:hypothetical protein
MRRGSVPVLPAAGEVKPMLRTPRAGAVTVRSTFSIMLVVR